MSFRIPGTIYSPNTADRELALLHKLSEEGSLTLLAKTPSVHNLAMQLLAQVSTNNQQSSAFMATHDTTRLSHTLVGRTDLLDDDFINLISFFEWVLREPGEPLHKSAGLVETKGTCISGLSTMRPNHLC